MPSADSRQPSSGGARGTRLGGSEPVIETRPRRRAAVEISEVRIKLMDDPHERLQAFCSITFDACFVIRDLKIIQGAKGWFVARPSRKLTDRCPRCHCKNHLR